METKTIKPKTYFFSEGTTTLNNIHSYADKAVPALLEQIKKSGLEESGPMEFIYFGASNDMNKEFTLRIAVPVKKTKAATDGFQYITTGAFKCVSSEYKGDVSKMYPEYQKMYEQIYANQYQPTDEIREVYRQWENPASEKNITEIQIGIN